mgnify:CR=1 FL=1
MSAHEELHEFLQRGLPTAGSDSSYYDVADGPIVGVNELFDERRQAGETCGAFER